jgi:hypothetical protein
MTQRQLRPRRSRQYHAERRAIRLSRPCHANVATADRLATIGLIALIVFVVKKAGKNHARGAARHDRV